MATSCIQFTDIFRQQLHAAGGFYSTKHHFVCGMSFTPSVYFSPSRHNPEKPFIFLFRIALNVFFVLFVCFTNNVFADEYFFWCSFFSFWIYNLFTPLKKKKKNVFYCIFSQLVHWIPSNCMAILHQNQKEKWTNQWVYFHIVSHVVSPAHGAGPTFQCWTERLCCIEDGITDGSTVV